MPIDLSFIGRGIQPLNTSSDVPADPQSDDIAHVQAIMQALQPVMQSMEPTPAPPKPVLPALPTGGQQIMGGIGDALLAFAQARLGHSPQPGPFATGMEHTERERTLLQQKYQDSIAAQAAADRAERNRIRAQAGLVGLRSGERAPKSLQHFEQEGVDAQGRPISRTMSFDPATGALSPIGDTRSTFVKSSEGRVQLVKNAQGRMEPVDVQTGMSMWTGKPVQSAAPANMAGVKQNLAEARRMLDELSTNYMAGPGHANPQTGEYEFGPGDMEKRATATAAANLTREGTVGKKLGLGGYAAKFDPHAVLHQRDLDLIPVSLAFPLSMTRRAVEGPMKAIRGALPDYSDPPEVWRAFTKQMNDIIDIAETLPWDDDPEASANAYQAQITRMAGTMGAAKDAAMTRTGTVEPTLQPLDVKALAEEYMRRHRRPQEK